ncbi:retrovirus-related pol polyprotein from transposon TNT 1-94 [Tanacetum coccineum]
MSTSNQQTLAYSRANERPPMLERGNYIPWESRFKRFLDNKLKEGERMLMFGSDVTSHVSYSRLMDEFDKFAVKEGESLESVYEILTTLVNIMDCNNVHPIALSINTKFLNCLQPEWSKYVTMDGRVDIQTKNAGYGGNGNKNVGDKAGIKCLMQEMEMITTIRLFTWLPQTKSTLGKANVQCYNCNERGHYARDCQKLRVRDAKYFREQMLLSMKDKVKSTLTKEENDFTRLTSLI